jgi:DNA-binding NarL/FixJ family response regulator
MTVLAARFTAFGDELVALSFPLALPGALSSLSAAEREVASAVLEGKCTAEIALERRRSARTIANQIASVFRKLGVNSRAELAAVLAARAMESASSADQR